MLRAVETRRGGFLFLVACLLACGHAAAQDYEREARWAEQTLATLVEGEAVRIAQAKGHQFLGLWQPAKQPRGAVIIAHGRGWAPDYDLYGALRIKLAEAGYSTLSIQMPVLLGTAKIGDYLPTFGDAAERLSLAADWLRGARQQQTCDRVAQPGRDDGEPLPDHAQRREGAGVGLHRHHQRAWRTCSASRFRCSTSTAARDWTVTIVGADERRKQIERIAGSQQVVVEGAMHFFEGQQDQLMQIIVGFLDKVLGRGQ